MFSRSAAQRQAAAILHNLAADWINPLYISETQSRFCCTFTYDLRRNTHLPSSRLFFVCYSGEKAKFLIRLGFFKLRYRSEDKIISQCRDIGLEPLKDLNGIESNHPG